MLLDLPELLDRRRSNALTVEKSAIGRQTVLSESSYPTKMLYMMKKSLMNNLRPIRKTWSPVIRAIFCFFVGRCVKIIVMMYSLSLFCSLVYDMDKE